ncbi:MAG: glucose-1-phosphate cytidylyltransferase [bacterium]
MKAVILAGGYGTRISEESTIRPKPMVEIGGQPILWHVMKIYSAFGINDFIICCGYKGYMIKEYFAHYFLYRADIRFDVKNNTQEILQNGAEPWKVALIDTGISTMTGGRMKRIRQYLDNEPFCMTYGDGVANVNIQRLVEFHQQQGASATMTAVQPPGRFGAFKLGSDEFKVDSFREKPHGDGAWVNGGFFVLEPEVFDYIDNDSTVWEKEPLENLARDHKLSAYKHKGFWQPMDTLRDKNVLEELWQCGEPPWKVW